MSVAQDGGSDMKPKVTFDMLLDKYSKQKAVPSDRPFKKEVRSPKGGSFKPGQRHHVPFELSPIWDDTGVMWV
ncbi:hypothetical protein FA727_23885, partial [Robertmurraya kyonggiensis]